MEDDTGNEVARSKSHLKGAGVMTDLLKHLLAAYASIDLPDCPCDCLVPANTGWMTMHDESDKSSSVPVVHSSNASGSKKGDCAVTTTFNRS